MIVYLVGMVVIGVVCSKRNKSTDDFYLGGRKLGPLVTAMSAEASDMSSYLLMGLPGLALLSGLADVVLVMEAKEKSGSLITADMALEQGRDIYALPGMVTEPLSCGCNRLIRQGAGILLNEEDLLEELVIKGLLKKKIAIISDTKNKIKLETKENLVYSKLGLYPRGLDDLQRETGLTPQEVMGICVSLQLKGCIQERSKNYYVRAK